MSKYNYSPMKFVKKNLPFDAEEDHCGIPFSGSFEKINHEKGNELFSVHMSDDIAYKFIPEPEPEEELFFNEDWICC